MTTITVPAEPKPVAIVLADCVASYSEERHWATLAMIKAQGGILAGWPFLLMCCQHWLAVLACELWRTAVEA
jgi:hypothetical protein